MSYYDILLILPVFNLAIAIVMGIAMTHSMKEEKLSFTIIFFILMTVNLYLAINSFVKVFGI